MKKLISLAAAVFILTSSFFCEGAFLPDEPSQSAVEKNLATFPENGIPVLMYHSISSKYDSSICVSEKLFRKQADWLYSNNYHTVTPDWLLAAMAGRRSLPENPILITFDDGFHDNYSVAWPILKEYGFNATFFIVTDQVNPYNIDWDQLIELVSQGNSIGSHTVHHYDLSALSCTQQESELSQSRRILEEKLGTDIKSFSFPYGKYNETTLSLLPELGYALSFTTTSGKVRLGDDEYLLKRVHIEGGMPMKEFVKQVSYP
ncbi:MAG: polysaccharide deacetylase family protein [Oscillospiraceae bacterium]|nr:polysaccharide deacetylase family protein [Oscillospiraceae bacterium]